MDTFKLDQPRLAGSISRTAANRGSPDAAAPSRPLLTRDEYDAYVEELDRLHEIRDRDLPDLLREAHTFVGNDAAEEIIQIQEDQAVVGARIGRLEELVLTALVVERDVASPVVSLGRRVEVEYLRTGRVASYRIVEAPPSGSGIVSAASPIGAALIGRSPGDLVAVELPDGRIEDLRLLAVLGEERAA